MSNLAQKHHYQIEPERKNSPKTAPVREEKRSLITLGEKILLVIFTVVFCFLAVKIVSTQAAIYDVNKDIQTVETTIEKQHKSNKNLELEVSELSTYERILKKAKELGLDLKEQNVKVVQD
ncbi:cell division protein FtsL [Bacillus pakistanensis]|uniref:Cell division protein FtsL n=1 Tax=Rossellomorea pakistanensis TaxID=992288 RepID=A0ABS2NFW3_9BACI|nr:cell division protein FtsL [Bacillus pakistanensis]MBM7586734.1 cell division protein FtsL [Bacillus pakistanensis]